MFSRDSVLVSLCFCVTAEQMVTKFIQITLGGPTLGFVMAHITLFWLVNIFNDALTEITITLASTYITFYAGKSLKTLNLEDRVYLLYLYRLQQQQHSSKQQAVGLGV